MKPKDLLSILGKINHNIPHRIPYVCNRDLDLFLKRLRSYYPDENYVTTLYQNTALPVSARIGTCYCFPIPNDSRKLFVKMYLKLGLTVVVDASLSRGFAAQYVASYVNSFVALPDFYTQMPKGGAT